MSRVLNTVVELIRLEDKIKLLYIYIYIYIYDIYIYDIYIRYIEHSVASRLDRQRLLHFLKRFET